MFVCKVGGARRGGGGVGAALCVDCFAIAAHRVLFHNRVIEFRADKQCGANMCCVCVRVLFTVALND